MNKVELYKYDIGILIGAIISSIVFLKSSDYVLLEGYENWNWLLQYSQGNEIAQGASISFLISAMFYFINVFLPKYESMKRNYKILESSINVILNQLKKFFEVALDSSDEEYLLSIKEDDFKKIIKSIDPESTYTFTNEHVSVSGQKGMQMFLAYDAMEKRIIYLLNFTNILQLEFIEVFFDFRSANISLDMGLLPQLKKGLFINATDKFWELHKIYKRIHNINKIYK